MLSLKNNHGKAKFYLFIGITLLIISMVRIATLGIHPDLPRLSSHQNGYYDYEGLIHYHTTYSGDATGSYKALGEIANQCHLDFLITTEHNNLSALTEHQEGRYGSTLILVGIESTRKEGYLLGLNMNAYISRDFSTDQFLSEIQKQGGFTIIAHPRNPRWHWRGNNDERIVGQEIVDLTDQFYGASRMDILIGGFYYPLNTPAAYMQIYQRPTETLKMWDEITCQRPFIGIYAPDVHQGLRIGGNYMIRFPRSEDILPIGHDHIILPTPFTGDLSKDKRMLYDALEKGRLYIAIDILQDATGFFFKARQGEKTVLMGDQLPAGVKTDFLVTLPPHPALKNVTINVYHNGQKIDSGTGPEFSFQATLPGAYRIEVECDIPTFLGLKKRVVWIYSNPIYLR